MSGFDELLAGLDPAVAGQMAGAAPGNENANGLSQADLDAFNASMGDVMAPPDPRMFSRGAVGQAPGAATVPETATPMVQPEVPGFAAATSPSQVPMGKMRGGKKLGPEIRQIEDETAAAVNKMGDRSRDAMLGEEQAMNASEAAKVASDAAKQGDTAAAGAALTEAGKALGVEPIKTTGFAARAMVQGALAAKEQEAAAKDLAMVAAKRADYETQLAKVGAMQIDPNQLVGSNPLAYGIQNMVASIAAISGKPGMQNFATMLNDGLMKAIDRDVDAQISNLKNQQEVTAGFKTVYDMVTNESQSHQEQRDRVYGAYLSAVDSYLQSAQMAADTKVTQAAFGQARAQLHSNLAENLNKLDEMGLKEATTRTGQWLSHTAAKANTALGYSELEERKRSNLVNEAAAKEEAKRKAAEDRAKASGATQAMVNDLGTRAIPDVLQVGKDGGSAPIMGFTSNDKDAATMKLLGASTKRLNENVEKMRDLQTRIKAAAGGAGTVANATGLAALQDEELLLARSIQEDLSYQIAQNRDPGGRVTDKDQESAKDTAILDPGYFRANTDKILKNIVDTATSAYGNIAGALVRDPLTPEEQNWAQNWDQTGTIDSTKVAPGWRALGKEPPPDTEAETIKKSIDSQKSGETSYNSSWSDTPPMVWQKYVDDGGGSQLGMSLGVDSLKKGENYRVPQWADEMNDLVRLAQSGDQDATMVIEDLAGQGKPLTNNAANSGHDAHADELRRYSRWILENLNDN